MQNVESETETFSGIGFSNFSRLKLLDITNFQHFSRIRLAWDYKFEFFRARTFLDSAKIVKIQDQNFFEILADLFYEAG